LHITFRALGDCKATYDIYLVLKEYITKNNIPYKPIKKHIPQFNIKEIQKTIEDIDETNLFYNKNCVFTGTLEKISRREASQIVVNLGGIIENHITKRTNFLILGDNEYNKRGENKSTKHKKAEQYILQGQELQIIPENVFYDMIE
jgi:DNA polymerase-3 subunit epsilon